MEKLSFLFLAQITVMHVLHSHSSIVFGFFSAFPPIIWQAWRQKKNNSDKTLFFLSGRIYARKTTGCRIFLKVLRRSFNIMYLHHASHCVFSYISLRKTTKIADTLIYTKNVKKNIPGMKSKKKGAHKTLKLNTNEMTWIWSKLNQIPNLYFSYTLDFFGFCNFIFALRLLSRYFRFIGVIMFLPALLVTHHESIELYEYVNFLCAAAAADSGNSFQMLLSNFLL